MLRLLVAALLLANLLFFTWSRGWLDTVVGTPARGDREPQRLANQVHPEQVKLWPTAAAAAASDAAAAASGSASAVLATGPGPAASEAAVTAAFADTPRPTAPPVSAPAANPGAARSIAVAAVAAASAAPGASTPASSAAARGALVCLETGPYAGADLTAVEAAVRAALPARSWSERKVEAGEWMIYMGPYPDREWLERKKRELERIRGGVPQEEVNAPPELARGLSLGRFTSQAAASTVLGQYKNRGIRTARVVRAGEMPTGSYLRVDQADAALAGRVTALKLPLAGRTFTPCPS